MEHKIRFIDAPRSTTLAAVLGLAVAFVLLVFASLSIESTVEHGQRIMEDRLPKLELIRVAIQEELMSVLLLRNARVYVGLEGRKQQLDKSAWHAERAAKALADLAKIISTAEGQRLYANVIRARTSLNDAKRTFRQSIDALPLTSSPGSQSVVPIIEDLLLKMQAYSEALVAQQTFQGQLVESAVKEGKDDVRRTRLLLAGAWASASVTLIVVGFLWRRRIRSAVTERDRRITALTENRDLLVREVHHRIKNHLQGVIGLIETQQALRPEIADELSSLHGHILALAGVHGLQGRHSGEIALDDLVSQQVSLLKQSCVDVDIKMAGPAQRVSWGVHSDHAVPLALVVTELLVNAMKHGQGDIVVTREQSEHGCSITICNAASNPPAIDFGQGIGLGTGLSLVKSLIVGIGTMMPVTSPTRFSITVFLPSVSSGDSMMTSNS